MIEPFNASFLTPTKRFRRLSILLAIHNQPEISQHKIAKTTHLSSSMVNNYMKELKQAGFLEIIGDTNRTQEYYLTPTGEKALMSLLVEYSTEIIQFYGGAKRELTKRLQQMVTEGVSTIVLFGAAETAEVVHAALKGVPLRIVGVIDSDVGKQGMPFNGFKIQAPEALKDLKADAIVITSFGKQEEIYEKIRHVVGSDVKIMKLTDL
jgi:DNA-binding MarR family transcriptional regulator